jgi:hypothetical protein
MNSPTITTEHLYNVYMTLTDRIFMVHFDARPEIAANLERLWQADALQSEREGNRKAVDRLIEAACRCYAQQSPDQSWLEADQILLALVLDRVIAGMEVLSDLRRKRRTVPMPVPPEMFVGRVLLQELSSFFSSFLPPDRIVH